MTFNVILQRQAALGHSETSNRNEERSRDATPMTERAVLDCGRDPASDRWTIALWCATAELLFCRYHYREEGAYDGGGRWRRRHIRHCLVGRPANLARSKAMAEHFCSAMRKCANAYERSRTRSRHVRRSFESAFAEGLAARLKAAAVAARQSPEGSSSYALEFAAIDALMLEAGIDCSNRLGQYDLPDRDRHAVRNGKAAAENISLILRTDIPTSTSLRNAGDQLPLPF